MLAQAEQQNVPERAFFLEQLRRQARACRHSGSVLALILINLRRLREVNATFGHQTGDGLLVEFGARIRGALRDADIMARTGDDEFSLILPGLKNKGHAMLAVNKILGQLTTPYEINSHSIKVEVALGLSLFPEHADEPGLLLQRAQLALAGCRRSRKPYEVYSNAFASESAASLMIHNGLEQAIKKDEMVLYYQPKIDLSTNRFCGAEALSRWNSAHGQVSPNIFIPVAEETGFILPLTVWALNVALRQCRQCRQQLKDVSVSVNLSAAILHNPDVVGLVERALHIWDIEPGHLVLEVTESAMMIDPDNSLKTLKQLHEKGISLSIDDFGTGYSSLAYLKKLPVQELKIDKSFVINMADDQGDEKIVRSIIDMAHNFKLKVTAEGVENRLTMERLKQLGCDRVQGFYLARPMPVNEVYEWVRNSQWGLSAMRST